MSIKEIADLLLNSARPYQIFGGTTKDEVRKQFRLFAKICHPDLASEEEKDVASRTTSLLNEMYEQAIKEIDEGVYNITDKKQIYKTKSPIFEFKFRGKEYKFYEHIKSEDVADVYEGIEGEELVLLKVAINKDDNSLLEEEFNLLTELDHLSLPKVITKLRINGKTAIIMKKPNGITLDELKNEYGNLSGNHIAWALERLLSVLGYLHSKKIVHGNIKPENILIDVDNHNVILEDLSLAIKDAHKPESKYRIVNDIYSPDYINKDAKVVPNTDIYAAGKIAIKLLGGDVRSNGMPVNCDIKIRNFIRSLLNKNTNDAWKAWDELINLRNKTYGTERFRILERKRR